MRKIGERIKILRKKHHLTQQELGLLMGFNENSAGIRIAQYENNMKVPGDDILERFIRVLDINEYALLSNHDDEIINMFIDIYWLGILGHDLLLVYKLLDVFKEYSPLRYETFEGIIKGLS